MIGPDAIFASNTSTLPITGLAEDFEGPEHFIGIHFFSPVEKMMLVEIIMGKETGDRALATALDYVRAIKKTPIVVNDAAASTPTAASLAYMLEGHLMVMEGVPPAMIENAAKMAGMPVGPLSLNDEVGIDLASRSCRRRRQESGRGSMNPQQEKLLVDDGREARALRPQEPKGFYDYPGSGQKALWPGLRICSRSSATPILSASRN